MISPTCYHPTVTRAYDLPSGTRLYHFSSLEGSANWWLIENLHDVYGVVIRPRRCRTENTSATSTPLRLELDDAEPHWLHISPYGNLPIGEIATGGSRAHQGERMPTRTPFRTGAVVFDEHFTNRAREVELTRRAMLEPGTPLLLVGERRQGKSSIIRQAGLFATTRGATVIGVDLWTASRLSDVPRRLVAAIPFGWAWRERLQMALVQMGLRIGVTADAAGNPGLSIGTSQHHIEPARAAQMILDVFRRLDEVAGEAEQPVTVVLDEFQRIQEIDDGGAGLLRGVIQSTSNLGYVCAGSSLSLVRDLIGGDGPFHGLFREVTVGPIEPDVLAPWLESRMSSFGVEPEAGVGAGIIKEAGPRTENIVRLAKTVFEAGRSEGRAGAAEIVAAREELILDGRAIYEQLWLDLADSHRQVLRAVADGATQLTGSETRRAYDLPTSGAVVKAVQRLKDQYFLATDDSQRITDPFFAGWIRQYAMPDGERS